MPHLPFGSSWSFAGCEQLAVIDNGAYDSWPQTAGKYKDVIRPCPGAANNLPMGQFEPLAGSTYRAVMRCELPGHEKCSRVRNWRIAKELLAAVDCALVALQLDGRTVKPKPGQTLAQAHTALPKH